MGGASPCNTQAGCRCSQATHRVMVISLFWRSIEMTNLADLTPESIFIVKRGLWPLPVSSLVASPGQLVCYMGLTPHWHRISTIKYVCFDCFHRIFNQFSCNYSFNKNSTGWSKARGNMHLMNVPWVHLCEYRKIRALLYIFTSHTILHASQYVSGTWFDFNCYQ